MLETIIAELRTEARSHELTVRRCDASLSCVSVEGWQRREIVSTRSESQKSAGRIRAAMALLQEAVS